MRNFRLVAASALLLTAVCQFVPASSQERVNFDRQQLIAAKTKAFKEKSGFERKRKDIINTLKDNDVTQFSTLLDGLQQAYDLDKTLKGNGPYTLFAPSDKAFKKMPDDDRQSLWANKKKLSQVLKYHIVFGQIPAFGLKQKSKLKTLEGRSVTLSTKGEDIFADKALITTTDIPCSNGVIHVLDDVIMPPLSR